MIARVVPILCRRLLLGCASFAVGGLLAGPPPLVMQLDWHLNAQFAGLLVAQRDGLYLAAGVEAEIRPLGDQPYEGLARLVAETEGMIGSSEGGLFLAGRAAGLPIVAIGTMFQASPLGLISLEKTGLASPADLAGRHVSIHDDGHEALDTVLHGAGLDRTRVRVDVSGYGMADLLAGKYDAKQGYLVDEFVKLQLEGHAVRALEYRAHGHLAYSQVYFVSERTLATRREELRRFLAASGEGWRRAAEAPAQTAAFIQRTHAPALAVDYLEASLRRIVPLLTAEQARHGAMRRSTWAAQVGSLGKTRPELAAQLGPMDTWADFSLTAENRLPRRQIRAPEIGL